MKSREEQQAMVEAKDQAEKLYRVIGNLPKSEASIDLLVQASELLKNVKDLTLPDPERWLYSNKNNKLYKYDGTSDWPDNCVEVPANDLAYVKSVIESKDIDLKDYNLQSFYKEGDTVIWRFGEESVSNYGLDDCVLMFVRKSKPEAKFVEYPITIREGKFYECGVVHIPEHCSLHELMDFVGFAGFKFLWEDGTETEWLEDCPLILHDGTPATPIKARFYIK